jgi:iron(III) transport system substrate-binding protein
MKLARRTLLATPFIAAAPRAFADAADWDRVVEKANQQGHLNLVHNLPPPLGEYWVADFNKAFPKIAVEATRLGSSELAQRFNTEYPAGASRTDAILTLWDDTVHTWASRGWVRTWRPPEAATFDPKFIVDDQLFVVQVIRSSLMSNKSRVKEADAPKDWIDVFNPKWKGRIGMDPPWRSVAVQQMLAVWDQLGFQDVAKRLKDNDVRFFNGSAGVVQALIRGDIWVAAVIEPPGINAIGDGAPVRISYPSSVLPAVGTPAFVPDKCPSPEAGMVFVNWAMGAQGQGSLQDKMGSPVTRPGIGDPKLVPGLSGQKIVLSSELLTPAKQTSIIDEWRKTFGLE